MYMRITRGTFDPGSMSEEQLTALIEEVADAIKTQPGFVSYQGGVNRGAGTMVAVSTWQDEDSASFPRKALGAVVPKIMDLGIRLEAPEMYDDGITV
jgi:quinol monooxygenase YgiN